MKIKFILFILIFFIIGTLEAQIRGSLRYSSTKTKEMNPHLQGYFELKNFFYTEYENYYYTPGIGVGLGYKINSHFYFGGGLNMQATSRQYQINWFGHDLYEYRICPTFSLLSEMKINILKKRITPTVGLKIGLNYQIESGFNMYQNVYIDSYSYINFLLRLNAGISFNIKENENLFINFEYYPLKAYTLPHDIFIISINIGYTFGKIKN